MQARAMSIRMISAASIAALAAAAGATADTVPRAVANAVTCFESRGAAQAYVESYGSMATEVDVRWSTLNSLDAWLTPSVVSARTLYAKTRANAREPRLTHLTGRWVYTWARWPAPMIQGAPRCLAD